jgi:hypothetical protein
MGRGEGPKRIKMPSLFTWLPRPRVRYQLLEGSSVEMTDRTVAPANAVDETRHSHDLADGETDAASLPEQDNRKLPNYQFDRDSLSTLGAINRETDDVTEEDLATLRRVSDKIPLSAWYVATCLIPLTGTKVRRHC